MYTVNVQDFQGDWTVTEIETKQDVFDYVTSLDMQQAVEVEDGEQTLDVIDFETLENWLNA